mmetsp:Transcript_8146/g.25914  ORF Transcript_8146/g.25914 Transcript_8146/m.25914 type:complete len:210 (-) Transcript_8146:18-647(-)
MDGGHAEPARLRVLSGERPAPVGSPRAELPRPDHASRRLQFPREPGRVPVEPRWPRPLEVERHASSRRALRLVRRRALHRQQHQRLRDQGLLGPRAGQGLQVVLGAEPLRRGELLLAARRPGGGLAPRALHERWPGSLLALPLRRREARGAAWTELLGLQLQEPGRVDHLELRQLHPRGRALQLQHAPRLRGAGGGQAPRARPHFQQRR